MKKQKKINIPESVANAMPHVDINIEKLIIGNILLDDSLYSVVVEEIRPEHFYFKETREVYSCMLDVNKDTGDHKPSSVIDYLAKKGVCDYEEANKRIHEYTNIEMVYLRLDGYIAYIKDMYMRRKLVEVLYTAEISLRDVDEHVDTIITKLDQDKSAIISGEAPLSQIRKNTDIFDNIEKMLRGELEEGMTNFIPSGFEDFDKATGGWGPGTFNILAARPSEGKTALAMVSAAKAFAEGKKVFIVSLESSGEKLFLRSLSARTRLTPMQLRHREMLSSEELDMALRENEYLKKTYIGSTADSGQTTIDQIIWTAKTLHSAGECDMLVVDYLQLLRDFDRKNNTREEEISGYSRRLKQLSRELQIPVIALCQFNREVGKNSDQIPKIENLRESGALEQDADTVTLIYNPARHNVEVDPFDKITPVTDDETILILDKNRDGERKLIYLSHNPEHTIYLPYSDPRFRQGGQQIDKKDKKKEEEIFMTKK